MFHSVRFGSAQFSNKMSLATLSPHHRLTESATAAKETRKCCAGILRQIKEWFEHRFKCITCRRTEMKRMGRMYFIWLAPSTTKNFTSKSTTRKTSFILFLPHEIEHSLTYYVQINWDYGRQWATTSIREQAAKAKAVLMVANVMENWSTSLNKHDIYI